MPKIYYIDCTLTKKGFKFFMEGHEATALPKIFVVELERKTKHIPVDDLNKIKSHCSNNHQIIEFYCWVLEDKVTTAKNDLKRAIIKRLREIETDLNLLLKHVNK